MRSLFCFCLMGLIPSFCLTQEEIDIASNVRFEWSDTCPPFKVKVIAYLPGDDNNVLRWKLAGETDFRPDSVEGFVAVDTGSYPLDFAVFSGNEQLQQTQIPIHLFCDTTTVFAGPVFVGCGHPDFGVRISEGCVITSLVVYDRWGRPVFESTEETMHWDFKDGNGQDLRAGTYFEIIHFTDRFGNRRRKLDEITIIR